MKDRTHFTIKEIREYINGFRWILPNGSISEVDDSTLHNAYLLLDDEQDGIVSYFWRQDYYKQQAEERNSIREMEREELEDDYV